VTFIGVLVVCQHRTKSSLQSLAKKTLLPNRQHSEATDTSEKRSPTNIYFSRPETTPEWEKRLRELSKEPDSDAIGDIATTVKDSDIDATLNALARNGRNPAGLLLADLLVQRWASNDLSSAESWASNLPDGTFGEMVCREVTTAFAKKDLAGAISWIEQLPESGNRRAAQLSLSAEAAIQNEATTAISLLTNLPPTPERDELLNYSACQWAQKNSKDAVAWLDGLGNTKLRDNIVNNLVEAWAVQNPFYAAEFAAASTPTIQIRDDVVLDVVRFWATSQPQQAATWVERFQEGPLRDKAFANLIDVWTREDALNAGTWLGELPESASRELAQKLYSSLVSQSTGVQ